VEIKLRHADPQIRRYVETLRKEIARLHGEITELRVARPRKFKARAAWVIS
jgi:hypothetical protein